jgi:DNA-binding IscR family transcriptional regulator
LLRNSSYLIIKPFKVKAMKQFILKHKNAVIGITAALLIGGVTMSFQDSSFFNQNFNDQDVLTDSVPDKHTEGHMKMKDFDKLDEQLDEVLDQLGTQLKNINFGEIEKTVEASLKTVDMESIMKTVEISLKDIDVEKIVAEATASIKDINWEGKEGDIKQALKEAKEEMEKAKTEMKNINTDEIKKELENAKKEMEKAKLEFKNIDMDKIMREAKEGVNKGREELRQLKTMFNEMEKDGLINSKAGFTLEYKDKDLYIDSKKQPEQVTDKYRKYFKEDHFKITIDKE